MKKTNRQINLFDISKIEHKSLRSDKVKTTDINILLNRVRITKKNEFKRKIMYISFTFLAVGLVYGWRHLPNGGDCRGCRKAWCNDLP